jgi:hypothetical protein
MEGMIKEWMKMDAVRVARYYYRMDMKIDSIWCCVGVEAEVMA